MLVTCKICNSKIDRDNSYKIMVKGRNNYYCTEEEYIRAMQEKENRLKVIDLCFEIIGRTTNTVLMKEIKEMSEIHTHTKILEYLKQNFDNLNKIMTKQFTSEFAKIRYFTTIVKNQLGDFKINTNNIETNIPINEDIIETINYKSNKKKSFMDYVDEY